MEDAWRAQQEALKELGVEHQHRLLPEVERMANERIQKLLERDSEPVPIDRYKEPFQYYEPAEGTGGLPAVICTCGEKKHHLRFKVLQRWSDKHFQKTGHNTKKEL